MATAVVVAGCEAATVVTTPLPRPTAPAGWVTVMDDSHAIRTALPPWMPVFDTRGAIFANEAARPDGTWLQLMLNGPRSETQPRPNQRLEDWLEAQIASAGPAIGSTRTITLPAGRAIVLERVARANTPNPWRMAAYAIQTPTGVAYLLIDGPPAVWDGREADVALIPLLIEFGPGR